MKIKGIKLEEPYFAFCRSGKKTIETRTKKVFKDSDLGLPVAFM